ncbi:MAG TPA: PQQ-binding-like beta-propeller repeat protein [Rhizomicrobium sp.]
MHITVFGLVAYLAALVPAHAQSLTVGRTSGRPGQSVSLAGSGFGKSEAIDVFVDTTDTELVVSNSAGNLNSSVSIPASVQPGTHYLTAIGRRSGDAAQVAYNVTTAWAQEGFGVAHLSWNPYENTISSANVATLGLLWSRHISTNGSTPAVVNGKVFVTSLSGLLALSSATGAVLWNKLPDAQFAGSPTVAGNFVYAITSFNAPVLYALNATTGATVWTQTLAQSDASPIVVNGIIYVACNNGTMYALKAATGALLWSSTLGGTVTQSSDAAVVDGTVYVGSGSAIYALDAATGAQIWSFATGSTIERSPSVANGIVYVGSDDGNVYALRAGTGATLWTYTTGSAVYQSPAVAAGIVYIGSQDDHLYALDAHTGALHWAFTASNVLGNAIVANKVVYATARDGSLHALDATTGVLLANAHFGYTVVGNPVVSDGVLYLNTFSNGVYAFGLLAGVNAQKAHVSAPSIMSLHPDRRLKVR